MGCWVVQRHHPQPRASPAAAATNERAAATLPPTAAGLRLRVPVAPPHRPRPPAVLRHARCWGKRAKHLPAQPTTSNHQLCCANAVLHPHARWTGSAALPPSCSAHTPACPADFASIASLRGFMPGPADDLEAVGYALLQLVLGRAPWCVGLWAVTASAWPTSRNLHHNMPLGRLEKACNIACEQGSNKLGP